VRIVYRAVASRIRTPRTVPTPGTPPSAKAPRSVSKRRPPTPSTNPFRARPRCRQTARSRPQGALKRSAGRPIAARRSPGRRRPLQASPHNPPWSASCPSSRGRRPHLVLARCDSERTAGEDARISSGAATRSAATLATAPRGKAGAAVLHSAPSGAALPAIKRARRPPTRRARWPGPRTPRARRSRSRSRTCGRSTTAARSASSLIAPSGKRLTRCETSRARMQLVDDAQSQRPARLARNKQTGPRLSPGGPFGDQ
jgi:hypothetical protein